MYAYVFVNDCETYETTRFDSIEAAIAGFKVIAEDPRFYFEPGIISTGEAGYIKKPWNSPVAAVQIAERRGNLYAACHSETWLVYADGEVTVANADPREAGREPHPNADSIDD